MRLTLWEEIPEPTTNLIDPCNPNWEGETGAETGKSPDEPKKTTKRKKSKDKTQKSPSDRGNFSMRVSGLGQGPENKAGTSTFSKFIHKYMPRDKKYKIQSTGGGSGGKTKLHVHRTWRQRVKVPLGLHNLLDSAILNEVDRLIDSKSVPETLGDYDIEYDKENQRTVLLIDDPTHVDILKAIVKKVEIKYQDNVRDKRVVTLFRAWGLDEEGEMHEIPAKRESKHNNNSIPA